jgi:hypothetical protein
MSVDWLDCSIKRLSCSCRKTTKVVDNENLGIYTRTGSDMQVLQSSQSTDIRKTLTQSIQV